MNGAKKRKPLPLWATAKTDGKDGRFLQAGNSLFLSREFHGQSNGACFLYLCMMMECGGTQEFDFSHGTARKKYGFPDSSFDRYSSELQKNGFIELVQTGGLAQYAPNKYRFCSRWKSKPAPQFGEGKRQNYPQFGEGRQ